MESLLRARLSLVSLLLFAGFALFFVWHTTQVSFDLLGLVICYAAHAASMLCLGLLALVLCSRYPLSARGLRVCESLVFGIPAAFFVVLQHYRTVYMVETSNVVRPSPMVR